MLGTLDAHASSHREAPFITKNPKVDSTDVYAFKGYEPNRAGYVTLIVNYQPFQDAYGGHNYFSLDPEAPLFPERVNERAAASAQLASEAVACLARARAATIDLKKPLI